jgi:predicted RNA-binding Zn ribbon-like protein
VPGASRLAGDGWNRRIFAAQTGNHQFNRPRTETSAGDKQGPDDGGVQEDSGSVELLTHGPADHIKPCHACRFLFIDHSKNSSRRWCSMDDCGKAAKIARYLQRRSDAHRS